MAVLACVLSGCLASLTVYPDRTTDKEEEITALSSYLGNLAVCGSTTSLCGLWGFWGWRRGEL